MFGQFAATSQFFLYGKRHFTKTGWEKHRKAYRQPDLLEQESDLSGRNFMITGANSGVGREVAQYLAAKGAAVYMVCRSRERAEAARADIKAVTGSTNLHLLVADVGLEEDVRRCWKEFAELVGTTGVESPPRLDALVCNAGALLNEKTLTREGVEVTFASHLLFGTYLLGSLAMPALKATCGSRLVVVSSGGMYNVPFPSWEVATSTAMGPGTKYDGQLAYAYAKRGQVLLCEHWAAEQPEVKVVSCHPGWTSTPGVDSAYGEQSKYLEPLRTPWEGAEGIAWLCVAPASDLESGAFYLDRAPQVKHMAGPFFTEGSFTKNTPEQVDAMLINFDDWANGRRPQNLLKMHEMRLAGSEARRSGPLEALDRPIELSRFMGRWYVVYHIPTYFDRDTANNIEDYAFDEASGTIEVTFTYSDKDLSKTSQVLQKARVENEFNTRWSLSPKIGVYVPLGLPYLLVDCAEDYSWTIVGVPNRNHVWVMMRSVEPAAEVVEALLEKVERLGFDMTKLNAVKQEWKDGAPGVTGADSAAVGA
jgi:dehydrogenase/reductase SDR family protein 12